MTTPTFNKFKSTTIYGAFNNIDYVDNSVQASAYFQRNLTCSGDITSSGIIYGKKLYYNNVDISSSFASLNGASFIGMVNCNGGLSTAYGTDVNIQGHNVFPSTNTGNKLGCGFFWNKSGGFGETNLLCYGQGGFGGLTIYSSSSTTAPTKLVDIFPIGTTFTTSVNGITPATSDNSTKFATTAYVKSQNYLSTASFANYALLSGATFTGALNAITQASSDNSTLVATTAYVKSQNYLTSASLSTYPLLSGTNLWTNPNTFSNVLNIQQPTASNSAILQFLTDTGASRANIYSSVIDNTFHFDILSTFNSNGFVWRVGDTNTTLLTLDSTGILTTTGPNATINNCLNIKQPDASSSAIFQFLTDTGASRANIYSSAISNVFRFDIQSYFNPNGFVWRVGNTGVVLMALDINGRLTTATSNSCFGIQTVIN